MAITIDTADQVGMLQLDEYCEWLEQNVNFDDDDNVVASAPMFRRLMNNPTIISDMLNKELENWRDFQSENRYSGQTFYLATGDRYFIRANVWMPPRSGAHLEDWEKEMFAYQLPHDHNFSFLTGGYYGVGYRTSIYEYDGYSVNGMAGENVAIRFLESTVLTTGKTMFYRASRDIHTQDPPTDLSISLNLMYFPKQVDLLQFSFDLERGCIDEPLKLGYGAYETLCRVAGGVGDAKTIDLLSEIHSNNTNPGIRAEALKAFSKLAPSDASIAANRALSDSHLMVRHAATQILNPEEASVF